MDHPELSDNEQTPLIQADLLRKPTPLPRLQIYIVLLLQVCEPLTSQSIYPYINQLISELDIVQGDEKRVGYYAGLIESLFFVTEACTVLYWSRVSDRVGRKPVMLLGLFGIALSMLSFGLSRTFWRLVLSRCLCGLLNGNVGVMRSAMGELTDSTNRAQGMALISMVWEVGGTLGPLIGGTLARPHERFPSLFTAKFWQNYPYFLPSLVVAIFVFSAFTIAALFFEESHKGIKFNRNRPQQLESQTGSSTSSDEEDKPLPLRKLLIWPVVISIANYTTLAFQTLSFAALFPLFLAMPIEIGGLGFDPAVIGYILGAYGALTGIWQFLYFAKVVGYLGERKAFICGMSMFVLLFPLFPLTSLLAKWAGVTPVVWGLVALMVIVVALMDVCYGCIFIFVTSSAPNRSSLGATNGLAQTCVSVARATGPALATSLFSFSVENKLLGGYGVYLILWSISCCSVYLALHLPERMWSEPVSESTTHSS